jgi:serine/threonine protein kinase
MAAIDARHMLQTADRGVAPRFCLSKILTITGICLAILGVIGLWARLSPFSCICMVGIGITMTLIGMYHDTTPLNHEQVLAAVRAHPHLAQHKENKLYYFPDNQVLSIKKEGQSENPKTCLRLQDGSYHLKTAQFLAAGKRKWVYLGYSCSLNQPPQVRSVEYNPPANDELFIYKSLNHCPFIVHCLQVVRNDAHKRTLILEYCARGPFHTAYHNLSQHEVWQVIHDYLEALDALHRIDFLHLDCHGGNLLLTQDNRGRLADFGSCRRISQLNTQEGFTRFMPDERGKYPLPLASRLLAPEIVACIQEFKQNKSLTTAINLSVGLSSSDSEDFTQQILGFSVEVNGQGLFTRQKNTRDASKAPEAEGEKPKTQVISPKADLWSLGVTLANKLLPESKALKHIFTCQAKYTHFSPFSLTPEQISRYLTELHHYPPSPLESHSLEFLFWSMLHPDPQKRCTTQEAKAIVVTASPHFSHFL